MIINRKAGNTTVALKLITTLKFKCSDNVVFAIIS